MFPAESAGNESDEKPPAAALSLQGLKEGLAANHVVLSSEEAAAVFASLVTKNAATQTCLSFLLAELKSRKDVKYPGLIFKKGVLQYGWVEKWRAAAAAESPEPKAEPPELNAAEQLEQEDPKFAAEQLLKTARFKKDMGRDLSEEEKKALEAAKATSEAQAAAFPRTFDPETGEKIEQQATPPLFDPEDDFKDDLSWEPEDEEKPAETAAKPAKNEELEIF